jgi:DNA polymerase III gamma/tau subunit
MPKFINTFTFRRTVMKVVRKDVVSLCVALGYKAAAKWNKARMERKLQEIAELGKDADLKVEEGTEDEEKLNKLLESLIKAKGVVDIIVEDDDEEEAEEEDKALVKEAEEEEEAEEEDKAPVKEKKTKKGKKAKKEAEEEEEEAEEPEDEAEEEEDKVPVKAKKEKKVKKEKKAKREGPSNKEQVYKMYLKIEDRKEQSPKKLAVEFNKVVTGVQLNTIAIWVSMWNKGKGLPACAKNKAKKEED